jgi:hypothetical protein
MDVCVTHVLWHGDMPVATVCESLSRRTRIISLLHKSFMSRYQIGIGSKLRVSHDGFLLDVLEEKGEVILPTESTVFTKWFLFKSETTPMISTKVARLLFLNGMETITDVRLHDVSLAKINGIGPVTMGRIQNMIRSTNGSIV